MQDMLEPGGIGRFLDFFPPGANRKSDQQWTVSRVLFPPRVPPRQAKAIRLGDALPRRSSALTRMPAPSVAHCRHFERTALTASLFKLAPGGACLAASHLAVARGLLPHDFTLTCASAGESLTGPPRLNGHRRYLFCGAFPRVTPGRRYRPPCPLEPGLSSRGRFVSAGGLPSTSGDPGG